MTSTLRFFVSRIEVYTWGSKRKWPVRSDEFVELPGTADNADYQAFLDDYSSQFTHEGELLQGHVLNVSDKEVIVDIGRKIEGSFRRAVSSN